MKKGDIIETSGTRIGLLAQLFEQLALVSNRKYRKICKIKAKELKDADQEEKDQSRHTGKMEKVN